MITLSSVENATLSEERRLPARCATRRVVRMTTLMVRFFGFPAVLSVNRVELPRRFFGRREMTPRENVENRSEDWNIGFG